MAQIDNAAISSGVKRMFGHDLQWWFDIMNSAYLISLIIGAFAAIAIAGTSWFLIKWQNELQAEKDAAFARYKIESEERTAKLENETAIANARAAEANVALEKLKTPRSLSDEQAKRIIIKLKAYAGTRFDIALQAADPEAASLMEAIELILISSAWSQKDWKDGDIVFSRPGKPIVGIVTLVGVFIQMHPQEKIKLGEAALALHAALTAEGIKAKAEGGIGTPNTNADALHVLIGKKPD